MRSGSIMKTGGVLLFTLWLSSCSSDGGSDTFAVPVPDPSFECAQVSKGEPLNATASADGADLYITIKIPGRAPFKDKAAWFSVPQVLDIRGATLDEASLDDSRGVVSLSLSLDTESTRSGSFTIQGTLNTGCALMRTFNFIIGENHVDLASLEESASPSRSERLACASPSLEGRA